MFVSGLTDFIIPSIYDAQYDKLQSVYQFNSMSDTLIMVV